MSWLIYAALGYVVYKMASGTSEKPARSKKTPKKKTQEVPLDEADPFVVLGIAPEASHEEIRRAYQERIHTYHPDRVATAAPEIQRLAHRRTKELNAAYAELRHRRRLDGDSDLTAAAENPR